MVSPQTNLFHTYSSLSCNSGHSGGGFGGVGGDHCLQSELRHYPSSPNSLTLYEQDHLDTARSLTSSASDSLGDIAQLEDLECNNESLKLDLEYICPSFAENYVRGDSVWSPTEPSVLKMEDVFQVDKNDVIQGPTLAALNGEDSINLLDDIVTLLGTDLDPQKGIMWGTQNIHNFVQNPMMQQHLRSCTISSPSMLPTSQAATSPPLPSPPMPSPPVQPPGGVSHLPAPRVVQAHQQQQPPPPSHQQQQSPQPIKQEPYQISAKFSVFSPGQNATVTSPTTICPQPPLPNIPSSPPVRPSAAPQKKQSLQEYLEAPPYTPTILTNLRPVKPDPTATPLAVVKQEPMDFENLTAQSMDRKWEEIRQFIDEGEKSRLNALAQVAANSPLAVSPKIEPNDVAYSPTEDMESSALKIDEEETEVDTNESDSEAETMDGDYDHAEFLLSEAESDSEDGNSQGRTGKKQKRYFWQYNTQAKGPKGKRLCKSVTNYDPHVLASFEDPVFDPDLNQMSYKHNGKARKGDGNDITPSPLKLYQIGQELKKLTRTINDLRPVNELPVNVRSRSRKEKNKLASRACRLKKKAQHEANKLKLYGLDNEHKMLMKVISSLKKNYVMTIKEGEIKKTEGPSYIELYNTQVQQYLTGKVAGHTAKFVNTVLAKVSGGDTTGGIHG